VQPLFFRPQFFANAIQYLMGNILFFASCLPLAAKKYFYALQINKTFVIFRRTLGSGRIKISSWQIHICKMCVQFYRRARLNASNLRPFLGPERKLVSRWTCNQDVLQPLLFQGAGCFCCLRHLSPEDLVADISAPALSGIHISGAHGV